MLKYSFNSKNFKIDLALSSGRHILQLSNEEIVIQKKIIVSN